jgi:hypothetical protein
VRPRRRAMHRPHPRRRRMSTATLRRRSERGAGAMEPSRLWRDLSRDARGIPIGTRTRAKWQPPKRNAVCPARRAGTPL